MTLIVATIPKSGTYFAREILVQAGLKCDPRHIPQGGDSPLDVQGDFRVGHPACYEDIGDHKVAFIYRNLRDVLVSSVRFKGKAASEQVLLDAMPIGPPKFMPIMGWFRGNPRAPDLKLTFNDLFTVRGVAMLVQLAQGFPCLDPEEILMRSINKPTRTWSGKRSHWEDYWTDEVQERWLTTHLFQLNREMGFE